MILQILSYQISISFLFEFGRKKIETFNGDFNEDYMVNTIPLIAAVQRYTTMEFHCDAYIL